ncbi:MAG: glycosyltransferase family 39 protein, partial [Candidatus Andersenbacteria bacterium]
MGSTKVVYAVLLIVVIAFSLRLPGLGTFMTADEGNWMIRSSEFWRNLFLNDDPGGTFRTSHPGVMTMWIGGSGIFLQEIRLGFVADESNLEHFRIAATLPIAISTVLLIGVITFLTIRLRGVPTGLTVGLVLATDPYLTGLSQILHLDALLSLFMLSAFLSFLLHWKTRHWRYLILTGVFTGLAMLNKFLPSLWLFVMYGLYMLISNPLPWKARIVSALRKGFFVVGVVGLMFALLWPALLVMRNTVDYLQKDTVTIVTDEHTGLETSEEPITPASFYLRTIVSRTTPFVLILWAAMVVVQARYILANRRLNNSAWVIVYTVGFVALITFVAKKGDRYALPALVGMMFTIGEGLPLAWALLRTRLRVLHTSFAAYGAYGVLALLLVLQLITWTPYAIAYSNQLFDV